MFENLRLQGAIKCDVLSDGVTRYYQCLLNNEKKAKVHTSPMKLNHLSYLSSPKGVSICVPIQPNVRHEMDIIETFVKENVSIPPELSQQQQQCQYKSLYRGNSMKILIDPFSTVLYQPPDEFLEIISTRHLPQLGNAMYSFDIKMDKIYIGPHKDGSMYSIIPYIGSIFVNC